GPGSGRLAPPLAPAAVEDGNAGRPLDDDHPDALTRKEMESFHPRHDKHELQPRHAPAGQFPRKRTGGSAVRRPVARGADTGRATGSRPGDGLAPRTARDPSGRRRADERRRPRRRRAGAGTGSQATADSCSSAASLASRARTTSQGMVIDRPWTTIAFWVLSL